MVKLGFRKKKDKGEQARGREEPVFPEYPQDQREPTGRRSVSEALAKPRPVRPPVRPPARPRPRIEESEMESLAPPAQLGQLGKEPDYEEGPEDIEEEPDEQQGEQDLIAMVDYLITNNLVEDFYTLLQERLELKTLYEKIIKARKLYGKRGI